MELLLLRAWVSARVSRLVELLESSIKLLEILMTNPGRLEVIESLCTTVMNALAQSVQLFLEPEPQLRIRQVSSKG